MSHESQEVTTFTSFVLRYLIHHPYINLYVNTQNVLELVCKSRLWFLFSCKKLKRRGLGMQVVNVIVLPFFYTGYVNIYIAMKFAPVTHTVCII